MLKTRIATLSAVALLGLGALGGVSVTAKAGVPLVQDAPPSARAAAPANTPRAHVGAPDTYSGQVQEGDQTASDGPA